MSRCDPTSEGLVAFLEARHEDITRRWEARMRASLSPGLPWSELLDMMPEFLAALVRALRGGQAPAGDASADSIAQAHGGQRYRVGFDVSALVWEYLALRDAILESLQECGYPIGLEMLRRLHDSLAAATAEALRCYTLEHERALRASEAKLQDIIDHAPALISAKDAEGRYLFVNRSFEELFSVTRKAVVGHTDFDCLPQEVAEVLRTTDREVLSAGRPLELEELLPLADGPHVFRSLKFPLPDHGVRPPGTCCISTDITRSRRIRRERDEARERLSSVLTSLPIIFFSLDPRGVIQLSEGQWLERIGLTPGQAVGRSVLEFIEGEPLIRAAVERALRGEAFSAELEFQGMCFDVRFLPEHGPDGALSSVSGLALDITERRRAEAELRQSETRYRLATLATSDTIWDWDLGTNQVHWSENIHQVAGGAPGETALAIDWWAERLHPEERERVMRGLHAIIDGGGSHWMDEYRFRREDGTYIIIADRGYVQRDERGRAVRMVGALQDITQRKVVEQEQQRRADFEQHLIGIVSHDLRNPLNAITMAAALLLKQGRLDAVQLRSVQRIVASAERASRMLRDLLDFTQARLAGGLPVEPRPVDLHELTRQVVEEVLLAHPQRQLVLEQQGDGGGAWDADRLAQLITNLVNNALSYGDAHCAVRVRTHGRPDSVLLSVHNMGAPIPAELMPRLFQPLKRGGSNGSKASHSIGLGLFIVKHIVEAHGGTISVHSTQENGTTFTVSLPRRPAQAPAPPPPEPPAPPRP